MAPHCTPKSPIPLPHVPCPLGHLYHPRQRRFSEAGIALPPRNPFVVWGIVSRVNRDSLTKPFFKG